VHFTYFVIAADYCAYYAKLFMQILQKRINLFDLHANLRANKCRRCREVRAEGSAGPLLIYWYCPLIAGQFAAPFFGLPPVCVDTF